MSRSHLSLSGGGAGYTLGRSDHLQRPLLWAMALVLAVGGLLVLGTSSAAAWPSIEHPETVSADGLPTVQIDGVVWTQAVVGQHRLRGRRVPERQAGG
jgi:hypothetical protein